MQTETKETQTLEKLDPQKSTELVEKIVDMIRTVYDPEIPVDIYALGLIYDVRVLPGGKAWIQMTLTSPNCPAAQTMPAEVEDKVRSIEGISDFELDLTFDPPWTQDLMSEEAKLELGFL